MIFLTLTGKTMAENRRLDGAELRADFLSPKERSEVSFFPKEAGVPVILTCRKPEDGGCWTDGEEARRGFFLSQRESGFSFFDFEENFDFPQTESLSRFGIRVIRSRHDFSRRRPDFPAFLRRAGRRLFRKLCWRWGSSVLPPAF